MNWLLLHTHTAALEWMRCSDGCLNRLIGLASREIGTDGWMGRMRERESKGREMWLRERETEGGRKRWMVRNEYGR